jgi:serine/threonine protein phosphatase PrpC
MHELKQHIAHIAAACHTGLVRLHQEDAFLTGAFGENGWDWQKAPVWQSAPGEQGILLAVADGMGGLNAGEVASALAIETVRENLRHFGMVEAYEAKTVLRQAVLNAHFSIEKESKKGEGEMGSTLVVAWLQKEQLHVAWVGDSRCYLYRPGEGLHPLTKDHSLVQEMVDEGKITATEAFYHPKRNVVTQSLGIPKHDPDPAYEMFFLRNGDIIMLCSDGLNSMVADEQIEHILETAEQPKQAAHLLIEAANAEGGHDNITVIVAKYTGITNGNLNGILDENAGHYLPEKTPHPTYKRGPSHKLILLMLPLVAILVALTVWTATYEKQSTQPELNKTKAINPTITPTTNIENPGDGLRADSLQNARLSAPTGNFVIQIKTTANKQEAASFIQKIKTKHPNLYLKMKAEADAYSVLVTGFSTRAEAKAFQDTTADMDLAQGLIYMEKSQLDNQ